MTKNSSIPDLFLPIDIWEEKAKHHSQLVTPFTEGFIKRRSTRIKEPVFDFLFTYYTFSPSKLNQWIPSYKEALETNRTTKEKHPWLYSEWFVEKNNTLFHNALSLSKSFEKAEFIRDLCKNILNRAPRFGCFGLHEWAMVYKMEPEEIRHQGYSLRLSPQELEHFVKKQNLCCTHYDAYRFFTKEAKPLNTFCPKIETRIAMEQGGCLHANMDLYKWSTKLWPWIGSEIIRKAFFLAVEGRKLDMRASPYDLRSSGYEPICIETEEGRKVYQKEQQNLSQKSIPIRIELLNFCEKILQLK